MTVCPGQTLDDIAAEAGTGPAALVVLNRLDSPILVLSQQLLVPRGVTESNIALRSCITGGL
jgi:LysM repeat protein